MACRLLTAKKLRNPLKFSASPCETPEERSDPELPTRDGGRDEKRREDREEKSVFQKMPRTEQMDKRDLNEKVIRMKEKPITKNSEESKASEKFIKYF